MQFQILFIYETTPLNQAVLNGDVEIVRILLSDPKIDVNCKSIFFLMFKNSCNFNYLYSNRIVDEHRIKSLIFL